jgi:hypothetical protein
LARRFSGGDAAAAQSSARTSADTASLWIKMGINERVMSANLFIGPAIPVVKRTLPPRKR